MFPVWLPQQVTKQEAGMRAAEAQLESLKETLAAREWNVSMLTSEVESLKQALATLEDSSGSAEVRV